MANSVHWYGHVLRREAGHVLRRALCFEVEGQRKMGRTWKKQVEEESVKVALRREDLPIKVECWHKSDCCWVELNLANLSCWGYYRF